MAFATLTHKTTLCVTEATGFVAFSLVKRLLRQGHTVHAIMRDQGGEVEPLPKEFDLVDICAPLAETDADENGSVNSCFGNGQGFGNGEKKEIVLEMNIHTTYLAITKSDVDDETTREREGYQWGLVERTKHHMEEPIVIKGQTPVRGGTQVEFAPIVGNIIVSVAKGLLMNRSIVYNGEVVATEQEPCHREATDVKQEPLLKTLGDVTHCPKGFPGF